MKIALMALVGLSAYIYLAILQYPLWLRHWKWTEKKTRTPEYPEGFAAMCATLWVIAIPLLLPIYVFVIGPIVMGTTTNKRLKQRQQHRAKRLKEREVQKHAEILHALKLDGPSKRFWTFTEARAAYNAQLITPVRYDEILTQLANKELAPRLAGE